MKEPTKNEIAKAVLALLNLESYYIKGWNIPHKTGKAIRALIEDLKFQYQFQPK